MTSALARARAERRISPSEVFAYYSHLLPNHKLKGKQWRFPCPVHHGTHDSFAVDPQTGQWFCHSQCGRGGDVYELQMLLTGSDFMVAAAEIDRMIGRLEPAARLKWMIGSRQECGAIVATYDYVAEDGHLLFQCVRYDPKDFKQRRPDGQEWIWNLDGVRRVLYRLPKLKDAGRVFVVEGERDVHTIEGLGLIGTCNPMGAGKWRPEYAEPLRGKQVVIIGDADKPGRKHAADIARDLLGVAAEARKVELPDAKDISDWVDHGGTRQELEELVACAEPLASHCTKKSDKPAGSDFERGAIPRSFELTDQGLFKMLTTNGDTQRTFLCGKLEVLSLTRDTRGENWGKRVRFQDPDGRIHEFGISETSLASRQGEWFGQLKARGLFISPRNDVRGHLLSYLSEAMPTARMRMVNQVGWHEDVFVHQFGPNRQRHLSRSYWMSRASANTISPNVEPWSNGVIV